MTHPAIYIERILRTEEAGLPESWESEIRAFSPSLAMISCSQEIDVLGEFPQCLALARILECDELDMRAISLSCLGLFACLQKFQADPAERAVALLLETPFAYIQRRLDEVGLGAGGDGFIAQEGAAILFLSKHRPQQQDALRVGRLRVLAKPPGLGKTQRFAARIADEIESAVAMGAQIASFENASQWSRRIVQSLHSARPTLKTDEWLSSCERDHRHFLALKPLIDLENHRTQLQEGPIALTNLGSGGRFGLLTVTLASRVEIHVAELLPNIQSIERVEARLSNFAFGKICEPHILHTDSKYYGLDDAFFEWRLTS